MKNERKNNKTGLICGRGRSLIKYKDLFDQHYEFVCLVNEFNTFIRSDKLLLQFLNEKSEGGYLTQLVNIEMAGVDAYLLENINVKEITIARLAYNGKDPIWRPRVDLDRFKNLGMDLTPQPDALSPYMKYIENSLGIAILNLILDKECDRIDIIGSDFYEEEYYLDATFINALHRDCANRLKKGIDKLVETFSDVTFNIYTFSTYKSSFDNCHVFPVSQ